ncbi:hypothetical protein BH23ACT11_BH23ACT11_24630 [soil metagenome]
MLANIQLIPTKLAAGGNKAQNSAVGRVLGGRYRIDGTLGKGQLAFVHRADDAVLGRKVALKVLSRDFSGAAYFKDRFKQEARTMASMDHENVVKIYDISEDGGVPHIVAEYVDGTDLGEMLSGRADGRLDEVAALKIASQLLEALSYAHDHRILHRNLKPSNILLTKEGVVKVADFGGARDADDEKLGDSVGRARYMSPEQLQGGEVTPQSDVYSVGSLLYHCLAGRSPFAGSLRTLVRCQLEGDPVPIRELNSHVSSHTESVLLRALSGDPADRYPSARAMLEDLDSGTRDAVLPRPLAIPRSAIRRRVGKRSMVALIGALAVTIAGLWIGASSLSSFGPPAGPEAQRQVDRPQQVDDNFVGAPPISAGLEPPAGEKAAMVTVPDVNAYFDYWAKQTLLEGGFEVKIVYEYQAGYRNRGVTWATDPAIGASAPEGSTVTIFATPKDLKQPRT